MWTEGELDLTLPTYTHGSMRKRVYTHSSWEGARGSWCCAGQHRDKAAPSPSSM